jgi:uncharacterized membrane protein
MLPATFSDVFVLLAQVRPEPLMNDVFHPPTETAPYIQMIFRWLHFIAGITWIGHLYFFNLVNVNFMKALDGPTKGKVIPQLMPRALWWFRWGAVITVLVGIAYYVMYMVAPDAKNRDNVATGGRSTMVIFLVWLVIIVAVFAAEFFVLRQINNGWVIAAIVFLLMIVLAIAVICWLKSSLPVVVSTSTFSIGIGGAMGIIMLLNVWGIIWPNQKRIISWTADNAENGTAIPADSAKLARTAFLASRTNTWLSVPMLFFMGASGHFGGFMGINAR